MLIRMPTAASDAVMLDPPALMNGRALPAKGTRPTMTAMLISASINIQMVSPPASRDPSWSGARRAMVRPRQSRITYIRTTKAAPMRPVSSAITA